MPRSTSFSRSALALALCGAGLAHAQSDPAPADFAFGEPVPVEQLDSLRGGFDAVKNDVQLSSTLANNTAVNVLSGNNTITDNAFTNATGLPMVIQNSGSNVSIQNATVVNVQLQ